MATITLYDVDTHGCENVEWDYFVDGLADARQLLVNDINKTCTTEFGEYLLSRWDDCAKEKTGERFEFQANDGNGYTKVVYAP